MKHAQNTEIDAIRASERASLLAYLRSRRDECLARHNASDIISERARQRNLCFHYGKLILSMEKAQ